MIYDKIKSVINLSKNSEQKKSPLKEAFFAERERFELSVPVYPVRRFSPSRRFRDEISSVPIFHRDETDKPLPSASRKFFKISAIFFLPVLDLNQASLFIASALEVKDSE